MDTYRQRRWTGGESRFVALAAVLAVIMASVAVLLAPARAGAATTTSITVDGTSPGRTFDGIGTVSGGGANSRALIDYPEPQRSQILDYLFKPDYGASMQILKVEIGGDANSTDGPEPSIERTKGKVNCDAGYEWWIMEQAAARNPNITFVGLEWAAPGWIGVDDPGNPSPGQPYMWSKDNMDYLTTWLGCAKSHHLKVGYLGGWNENPTDKTYFEALRKHLDATGDSAVKLVAPDEDNTGGSWSIADDLAGDSAFDNAVGVVGLHGVCWHSSPSYTGCPGSTVAEGLDKPLWVSEDDNDSDGANPQALARNLNREYIDAKVTADIKWPLVGSWPSNEPFYGAAPLMADQPWSGSYTVGRDIWVMAHTTQFAQPGWKYLDGAGGYLAGSGSGGDPHSGSYVTLKSGRDYSTVIETTDAQAPQTVSLTVKGGLSTKAVQVWHSNVASTDPAQWFDQEASITPHDGTYSLTLQPGSVYTLTTTRHQAKGAAVPPPSQTQPLPYRNDFSTYPAGTSPRYFHDWAGAFETATCPGDSGTRGCLRQVLTHAPLPWHTDMNYTPTTFLGDPAWKDYQASADVRFEQPSTSAELLGRVDHADHDRSAYHLKLGTDGAWSLYTENQSATDTTLASGTVPAPGTGSWHNLALSMNGSTIEASIDHTRVATLTDTSHATGQTGFEVGSFAKVDFTDVAVTAPAGTTHATATATSQRAGSGARNAVDGDPATAWSSETSRRPQSVTVDLGAVKKAGALSYLPPQGRGAKGTITRYTVYTSTDGTTFHQAATGKWRADRTPKTAVFPARAARYVRLEADTTTGGYASAAEISVDSTDRGPITDVNSGKCVDVSGGSTSDGGSIIQWPCGTNKPNQTWQFVQAPGNSGAFRLVSGSSGKCLDVTAASTGDGAPIVQWACDATRPSQQWTFVQLPGGSAYQVVSVNSGKCLDLDGSSTSDGAPLVQLTCDATKPSQQWNYPALAQ
ncbi:RICIN domain-containing protein [Streptomyces sp. NBC_00448]|uniref:RICIN domain-containing protein n=1 Tax=Streptomyces sp. NBC_00448 TaxID=2903652 RepID=UPI002E1E7EFA